MKDSEGMKKRERRKAKQASENGGGPKTRT